MKKKTLVLIGFIIAKFVLQYILISPEYDLQRDEYLHLDLGHHLAWGYASVPPVTSWLSRIIFLLGNSVFWVKFFPALIGVLTIVVVWKTVEELKGNLFALVLASTCVLFSALLRLNTLYQPNSIDVLCWAAVYFTVIKYFNTSSTKYFYLAAILFAFGFMNKYNIVFLAIGLIPSILLTQQRKLFMRKETYLAAALAFAFVSPNLLWQYNNNFPVIRHLNDLASFQLVNVSRIAFLKSQVLFFMGSFFVIVSALFALLVYEPFKKYRSFFWALPITLIVFLYFRAKDYYAIGLYPVYIAFGSVYLADILNQGWKKYLQPLAIAIPLLLFIPMFYVAFPNRSPQYIVEHHDLYKKFGLLRWEDGQDHPIPQDFADMLGWKELAQKVDSIYLRMPDPELTLVLCDNYGQAGAINYYTKAGIKANSFNADYINWFNLDKQYVHLIRVKEFEEREDELIETSPYFDQAILADSIANPFAREYGTAILSFKNTNIDINERIKLEIKERLNRNN